MAKRSPDTVNERLVFVISRFIPRTNGLHADITYCAAQEVGNHLCQPPAYDEPLKEWLRYASPGDVFRISSGNEWTATIVCVMPPTGAGLSISKIQKQETVTHVLSSSEFKLGDWQ